MRTLGKTASFIACAALLALVASPASAATILPAGSTWEFTFTDPTASATWNTTIGGGWATGPAPFGNNQGGYSPGDPTGLFDYVTYWPADGTDGNDLWVRTAVNLTGFNLASVAWHLGVDNGFVLYANGIRVSGANAEGYTGRWEYNGGFTGALHPGLNIIALELEDHGGLTAFDMEITGDRAPVPEPGSMILLGTGLVGLGRAWRKRRG
jgi:opacity protein-like surface antigen